MPLRYTSTCKYTLRVVRLLLLQKVDNKFLVVVNGRDILVDQIIPNTHGRIIIQNVLLESIEHIRLNF